MVSSFVSDVVDTASSAVESVAGGALDAASSLAEGVVSAGEDIVGGARDAVKDVGRGVTDIARGVGRGVEAVGRGIGSGARKIFRGDVFDNVKTMLESAWQQEPLRYGAIAAGLYFGGPAAMSAMGIGGGGAGMGASMGSQMGLQAAQQGGAQTAGWQALGSGGAAVGGTAGAGAGASGGGFLSSAGNFLMSPGGAAALTTGGQMLSGYAQAQMQQDQLDEQREREDRLGLFGVPTGDPDAPGVSSPTSMLPAPSVTPSRGMLSRYGIDQGGQHPDPGQQHTQRPFYQR